MTTKIEEVKVTLAAWAKLRGVRNGAPGAPDWVTIDVDAETMYPAILAELRAYYKSHVPAAWFSPDGSGTLLEEWKAALAELDGKAPTAYWLEVAYQFAKLDLQVRLAGYRLEIHIHDKKKQFAQKDAKPGRGAHRAAGGLSGGKEARDHFARVRGVLPA